MFAHLSGLVAGSMGFALLGPLLVPAAFGLGRVWLVLRIIAAADPVAA